MMTSMIKRILFTAGIAVAMFSINSCAPKYNLTVDTSNGGSVTVDPSGYEYAEDELVTVNAQPDDGYYFAGWNGDTGYVVDSSGTREIQIQMPDDDISLSADFAESGDGWTVMVYMAGDNDLYDDLFEDIDEIESGLAASDNSNISQDLKIIVLYDSQGSSNTELFLMSADSNEDNINSSELYADFIEDGEVNMGDPDTLEAFIEYCLDNYPSTNNALIISNHGGGAKSINTSDTVSREIAYDFSSSYDVLFLDEVQQVMSGFSDSNINIIGMDACLMGTVEVAYELRGLADYFVASPASEWPDGWDYTALFSSDIFGTSGNIPSASEFVNEMITQYKTSTYGVTGTGKLQNTLTAVDLSTDKMQELKDSIDALAAAFSVFSNQSTIEGISSGSIGYYKSGNEDGEPYTDIYDFCMQFDQSTYDVGEVGETDIYDAAQEVLSALADSIVAAYGYNVSGNSFSPIDYFYETDDSSAERGLSIFFSHSSSDYNDDHWWYTDDSVAASMTTTGLSVALGNIDFADSTDDATVNTWRELFDEWYK